MNKEALETVDIDMFSSVPDVITAVITSKDEIQAVKDQIYALEDEIERLKGLDGKNFSHAMTWVSIRELSQAAVDLQVADNEKEGIGISRFLLFKCVIMRCLYSGYT